MTPVTIHIGGEIVVKGLPQAHRDNIKSALKLKNPSYYQAIRRNPRAKYALSEYIPYYREDRQTHELTISRGNSERLFAYLESRGLGYKIVDERTEPRSSPKRKSSIKLRDYQTGVPEEITTSKEQGVVELYTGFGKTLIALKVAELLQVKTLIITPKVPIYEQFKKEYTKYFSDTPGEIKGKKFEIKDITVATKQSLVNAINRGELRRDAFGCIIADECHMFVPEKSRLGIEYFSAKFSIWIFSHPRQKRWARRSRQLHLRRNHHQKRKRNRPSQK
jgi:superfamily II DNA or RNA helicase